MAFVDLAAVRNLIGSVLLASRGGYGVFTPANPLHPQAQIDEAVKAAASGVIDAILSTPGNRYQAQYYTLNSYNNGDQIKGKIGAVYIDGDLGTRKPPSYLRKLRANVSNQPTNVTNRGFYSLQGHVINFLGSNCKVESQGDPSSIDPTQVPGEFEWIVVAGGFHFCYSVAGTNLGGASVYGQTYLSGLEGIRKSGTIKGAPTPEGTDIS